MGRDLAKAVQRLEKNDKKKLSDVKTTYIEEAILLKPDNNEHHEAFVKICLVKKVLHVYIPEVCKNIPIWGISNKIACFFSFFENQPLGNFIRHDFVITQSDETAKEYFSCN